MNINDQGARDPRRQRYHTVPRVLIFLTSHNPQTGEEDVLLLKGAATKRLWANLYNGLGGHVEAGEDVYGAALREVREEAGLEPARLVLRGVVNIDTGSDEQGPQPGIMMFVFAGEAETRTVIPGSEGEIDWLPLRTLADYPLVDDLYELIPLALGEHFFYGHYAPQEDGTLRYAWREI